MNQEPKTRDVRSRRRRRRTALQLALGGLALVGIGAAATSAAWTDPAYFTGDVKSATVDLRGRMSGSTTWSTADTAGTAVALGFASTPMVPGGTQVKTIELQNAGNTPLNLTWSSGNPTFLVDASCFSVAYSAFGASPLAAGSTTSATVTVTLKSDAPQATCANKSPSLTVQVVGATA
ncbi:hypothetical protein [Cellulomonas sp. HZM]|uniref:hypothetical protein n=1 Tax=Cellulomonas sp. HZM TaxID=1454010 RepID=UPI00068DF2AF|nr:hypothetical protein [Cellulomonas sp. HZM]